jgi:hypothetical protein
VNCRFEKLVAEAGDSSSTHRKETSAVGSRYRATANEDVTVVASECVIMNREM